MLLSLGKLKAMGGARAIYFYGWNRFLFNKQMYFKELLSGNAQLFLKGMQLFYESFIEGRGTKFHSERNFSFCFMQSWCLCQSRGFCPCKFCFEKIPKWTFRVFIWTASWKTRYKHFPLFETQVTFFMIPNWYKLPNNSSRKKSQSGLWN